MASSAYFSKSINEASDEVVDIYCEPCADDGKQTEADGFCVNCSQYLCGQCYKDHTKYKALKHHVFQDKYTKDVCLEKCAVHPANAIEYFCRSCDMLGCSACLAVNHGKCKNVDHIPDITKDIEKSEEFKEFKSKLDKKLEAVTERKKEIISSKTEKDEMRKKAKSDLKKQHEEIKKFFGNLDIKMERRIEDIDRNNKDTLKAAERTCDSANDELGQMKNDMDAKLKTGQKCELFIAMKNYKPKMEQVDTEFENLATKSYALTPSSQIKEIMKSTSEICRVGTACVAQIQVGTNHDKEEPCIVGHAVVQNHYLAVVDSNNSAVKVYDTQKMNLVSEMVTNFMDFRCITSVEDNKIAIAVKMGAKNKIIIKSVSTSGGMETDYLIDVDCQCNSMTYSEGRLYLVTCQEIVVIDMHGKLLEKIRNPDYSERIAVSPDNETIYVIDVFSDTVTSMTLHGKTKSTYEDKYLKFLRDLTVDNEGLVYALSQDHEISYMKKTNSLVASMELEENVRLKRFYKDKSNKFPQEVKVENDNIEHVHSIETSSVYQLTGNCRKVKIVIENVPGTTISYSRSENRLFLGYEDMIRVFQIE